MTESTGGAALCVRSTQYWVRCHVNQNTNRYKNQEFFRQTVMSQISHQNNSKTWRWNERVRSHLQDEDDKTAWSIIATIRRNVRRVVAF